MDLLLQDKYVIVTGGAKGIGAGIVRQLAAEGAIPIIIGRNHTDNDRIVQDIKSNHGKAYSYTCDLGVVDQLRACCALIDKENFPIYGIVNNAGVNDGVGLEKGNYQDFMKSLHNNLIHVYLLTQHFLPSLKKTKGTILNVGSKVAETGQGQTSAYAASKGAMNALTREWAVELLPYGIRVNTLIVAECYTPLYENWLKTLPNPEEKLAQIVQKIPLEQRMTSIAEIASMGAFLLSPQSSHTTGQLVHVDGGYVHLDRSIS